MIKYQTIAVFFLLYRILLTDVVSVKVYSPQCTSLKCDCDLLYSMKNLFETSSPPVDNSMTCIGKKYVGNGLNFYASKMCSIFLTSVIVTLILTMNY